MKKMRLKFLSIILVLSLFMDFSIVSFAKPRTVLNKTKATIHIGESITLKLKNVTKRPKWRSSNKDVATVNSKGKVTAKKAGKVKIIAKTGNNRYSCKVTVPKQYINRKNITCGIYDSKQLKVYGISKNDDVIWSSDDESIVTVSNDGVIIGRKAGKTNVYAVVNSGLGKIYKCKVCILDRNASATNIPKPITSSKPAEVESSLPEKTLNPTNIPHIGVTGVQLSKTDLTLYQFESTAISATVLPFDATNKNVIWNSSNVNVASISSNGIVTGDRVGVALISVTTEEGKFVARCRVTVVTNSPIYVPDPTNIPTPIATSSAAPDASVPPTIKPTPIVSVSPTIKPTPTASVSPETSTSPSAMPLPSADVVPTPVHSDKPIPTPTLPTKPESTLTPEPSVTSTPEPEPDITYEPIISPEPNDYPFGTSDPERYIPTPAPEGSYINRIYIDYTELKILAGQEFQLKIVPTNRLVSWSSSDTQIAEVTEKGVVIAKKSGTVTVTASLNGKSDSCKVIVLEEKDFVAAFEYNDNKTAIIKCINKDVCTSAVIPNGIKEIKPEVFKDAGKLCSVDIPNDVQKIGENAFYGCTRLKRIEISGDARIIYEGTFEKCKALKEVILPNSLKEIRQNAFKDAEELHTISIPNNVQKIGISAFYGCKSLADINIPNNVTDISDSAFYNCSSLNNIIFPNSLSSIGNGSFYGCESLTNISIPNSVTVIGNGSFYGCGSLTNISIPNNVISIGDRCFHGCKSLEDINIPNSVTSLGIGAFAECTTLRSVSLPRGIKYILNDTFNNCTSLYNVNLPEGVLTINNAFINCSKLENVTIPSTVEFLGTNEFKDCKSLKSIVIPDGVVNIGNYIFNGCTSLTDVVLSANLQNIPSDAFKDCPSLSKLTIPSAKTEINTNVLHLYDNLIIYGVKNSFAETWANDNIVAFVEINT